MTSIFNRVYSYRERENKNNRENFLIEIFAFCLESDEAFLKKFLSLLNISFVNETIVSTQKSYLNFGRPDLECSDPKLSFILLIECKINHYEREGQLVDYTNILRERNLEYKEKHLLYLTKYYDPKKIEEVSDDVIFFHQLKWSDIYNLITDFNDPITQQLKIYLKEEAMDSTKNFNYTDLSTLLNISSVISKMDQILDGIKSNYSAAMGSFPPTSRGSKLIESWYGVSHERSHNGLKYWINTGFRWYYEDDIIYIGIRIWLPQENKELIALLNRNLNTVPDVAKTTEWVEYDGTKGVVIESYRYLSEFIGSENEQVVEITEYLSTAILQLSKALP